MRDSALPMINEHEGVSLRAGRSLTSQSILRSVNCGIPKETGDLEASLSSQQLPIDGCCRPSLFSRINNFFRKLLLRDSTHIEKKAEDYEDEFLQWRKGFLSENYREFPEGWPQLAAFLNSCGNATIYRRFGSCHSRLLVNYMADITSIEKKLLELDQSDSRSIGEHSTSYRLETRVHKEDSNTAQIDLLAQLESKLLAYDNLLLKHHQLKSLDQTSETDHANVSKWIWKEKPVREGQYDFIYRYKDFVSLVPPPHNRFETSVRNFLISWFKKYITVKGMNTANSNDVQYYSAKRITFFARLCMAIFAVLILYIPVLAFLLTSMSRDWMAVVVLVFVFLFSIIVSLLPEARGMDIFVGSATYCAVLVTFLGNLQGAASCNKT